jgi:hypothetical protein
MKHDLKIESNLFEVASGNHDIVPNKPTMYKASTIDMIVLSSHADTKVKICKDL